jgi:hypothetical protein
MLPDDRSLSFTRTIFALIVLSGELYGLPFVAPEFGVRYLDSHPQLTIDRDLLEIAAMTVAGILVLIPLAIAGASPFSRPMWAKLFGSYVLVLVLYFASGDLPATTLATWLQEQNYRQCRTERLNTEDGRPWPERTMLWSRAEILCPEGD